jgi:hypothetical protein
VKSCETPIEAHIVSFRDPLWLLLPHPTRALEAQIYYPCLHLLSLGPPSPAWSAVICHPTRAPVGSVTCSHNCSVTCARHLLHRLRPSAHLLPHGASIQGAITCSRWDLSAGDRTSRRPHLLAMDPTNQRSSGAGRRRSVAAAKGHGQQHVPAPTSLRSPSSPDSQQVQSPNPPWYVLWTLVFFLLV